jgi:dihydroorotate dehydrogenase
VQVYSALVYGGPGLVTRLKRELLAALAAEGFADVRAAVGATLTAR